MGWAGCGCDQCREYESVRLIRGDFRLPVKIRSDVPRDEVWLETRTQRVKIVNLAMPREIQPDEWVGGA